MYEKCLYLQARMVDIYGVYAVFQRYFVVGQTCMFSKATTVCTEVC